MVARQPQEEHSEPADFEEKYTLSAAIDKVT